MGEAKAAAALNQDEECPFYDEKGLYSNRDSARKKFGIASVQDMPNIIAVNMLAADLARNLSARIFRSEDKAGLFTAFLCVMGYISDGNALLSTQRLSKVFPGETSIVYRIRSIEKTKQSPKVFLGQRQSFVLTDAQQGQSST